MKLDVGHYDACSWCDECAPLTQVWEGDPPPKDQSKIFNGDGPHCKICVGCTAILRFGVVRLFALAIRTVPRGSTYPSSGGLVDVGF